MKRKYLSVLLMGALAVASTSMVTSCKDYDDDITANATDIKSLQSKLETLKTDLETQLATCKSNCATELASAKTALEAAIAKKADATEIATLQTKVNDLTSDLATLKAAYETKIKATDEAIAKLQSDYAKALENYSAVTGDIKELQTKLGEEEGARKALETNLELQKAALETAKKELGDKDTELQGRIEKLEEAIKNFNTDDTVKNLQTTVNKLNETVTAANKNLSVLEVLVNKMLTSISLLPDLYVNGIEAIEFKTLAYTPVVPGTSGYASDGKQIFVDNGETEVTYALSPNTVKLESLDAENIEVKAAKSVARESRAANSYVESPVKFNGIASFNDGLMTVKMKKTTTAKLNLDGNNIYIVSLNVPRKEGYNGQQAAVIKSENSRLVETYFTPQIADKEASTNDKNWGKLDTTYPGFYAKTTDDVNTLSYHFNDSTTLYNSAVDAKGNPFVRKELPYNKDFDLNTIVTGCYDRAGYSSSVKTDAGNLINKIRSCSGHDQITAEELKKFGLEFRYAIPTQAYNNEVDNNTNQQEFAKVTANGILTSKTPEGAEYNAAVVGKEPIIRIDLVDVVNNKLVDQRYMKIKWVQNSLADVALDSKQSEAVLGCDGVKTEFTWREFVDPVYAKINELKGISQKDFDAIYPAENVVVTAEGWTSNSEATNKTGKFNGSLPKIKSTTNEQGDALAGTWNLKPEDIKTVYFSKASDTKVFKARVKFVSKLPNQYPNLYFDWYFTVKLPQFPSVAYYDQYWSTKKQVYDVLPIQYNTDKQTKDYCVYDNDLTNGFVFDQYNNQMCIMSEVLYQTVNGKKEGVDCRTWDFQFSDNTGTFVRDYQGQAPDGPSNAYNDLKNIGRTAATFGAAPASFGGYILKNTEKAATAATLNWHKSHTSWCDDFSIDATHKNVNLFADHNNKANWNLINPLSTDESKDTKTTLGLTVPAFTHDKKVAVTLWWGLNKWNLIPVKTYDVCLIAPLRVNSTLEGAFEDGHVSGTAIDCSNAFKMTDFRGYTVADENNGKTEQTKYQKELYKYYECHAATWDFNNVRYTLKVDDTHSIVASNSLDYDNSMDAATLKKLTNGNVQLSISSATSWNGETGNFLVFKNNGGSDIKDMIYAYIPYSMSYGFGELKGYVKVPIYGTNQDRSAKRH